MDSNSRLSFISSGIIIPQTDESDFGRSPCSREHFIAGVLSKNESNEADVFYGHEYKNTQLCNKSFQQTVMRESAAETLEGSWYFGGIFAPHFGHFLAESCHRLWAWKTLKDNVKGIIFLPPPKFSNVEKWGSFIFDILALFGINKSNIKIITSVTEVEHIVIPEQGASFHGDVKPWYQQWLSQNPLIDCTLIDNVQWKNVFISRKNYKLKGRIAGMDAFAEYLCSVGYTEVCPEQLPLKEQLALLSSAENIIWEEGSAVHLMELLAKQHSNAALIMRRPTNQNIQLFLQNKYDDLYTDSNIVIDQCVQKRGNNAQAYFENVVATVNNLKERGFISVDGDIGALKGQLIKEELADARAYLQKLKVTPEERQQYISNLRLLQKLRRLSLDKRHTVKRALFNNPLRTINFSHMLEDIRHIAASDKVTSADMQMILKALTHAETQYGQAGKKQLLQEAIAMLRT